MRLVERILKAVQDSWLPAELAAVQVERVCVGLHWTVVESAGTGLAHTYRETCGQVVAGAGGLAGTSAWEMAQKVLSTDTLDASLGWAALKSLMPRREVGVEAKSVDVRTWVRQHGAGRRVAVVGRFPFAATLGDQAERLYRFEIHPEGDELPLSSQEALIPTCHINLITGTTLINHTLDRLLILGANAVNLLVGPSTPMHPLLLQHGVDMLCGVEVTNTDALVRTVMEGAPGLRQLAGVSPVLAIGPFFEAKMAAWPICTRL